jgi:hypothetical protein
MEGFTWTLAVEEKRPFQADPRRFMLLKPRDTKRAAERFPFDLMYDPEANSRTLAGVPRKTVSVVSVLIGFRYRFRASDWISYMTPEPLAQHPRFPGRKRRVPSEILRSSAPFQ